jgi:hypothetical protein
MQYYRGQLRGVHQGVALSFAVRVSWRPLVGWQYMLLGLRVGAPTGETAAHLKAIEHQHSYLLLEA